MENIPNFNEYVDSDRDLNCYGLQTEDDIVDEILKEKESYASQEEGSDEEGIEIINTTESCQTFKQAWEALDALKSFLVFKDLDFDEVELLEEKIFKAQTKNVIQKKITDFFAA